MSSAPATSEEDDDPRPIFDDSDAVGTLEVQDMIQANVHFYIAGLTVKHLVS